MRCQGHDIVLYKLKPGLGMSSLSYPCVQVEAYLILADIKYKSLEYNQAAECPCGQLPAVEIKGTMYTCPIQTSSSDYEIGCYMIRLVQKHAFDTDAQLEPRIQCDVAAYQALVNTQLQHIIEECTWRELGPFIKSTLPHYGANLPFPMNYLSPWSLYVYKNVQARHKTQAKIYDDACSALASIRNKVNFDDQPGNRPSSGNQYLFGSQPSTVDAQLAAILMFIQNAPVAAPVLKQKITGPLANYASSLMSQCQQVIDEQQSSNAQQSTSWSSAAKGDAKKRGESQSKPAVEPEELRLRRGGRTWLSVVAILFSAFVLYNGLEVVTEDEQPGDAIEHSIQAMAQQQQEKLAAEQAAEEGGDEDDDELDEDE